MNMRLDIKTITSSSEWVGKKIYICAFVHNPRLSRAVKNLPATECIVDTLENYKLLSTKTTKIPGNPNNVFIMTRSRSKELNYNNVVKPFDNIGQMMSNNNDLYIFDNIDECNNQYLSLIKS